MLGRRGRAGVERAGLAVAARRPTGEAAAAPSDGVPAHGACG
jgi:hypothetical protein